MNNTSIFTSSVVIPRSARIYCLVKKATHIGYSSTWSGAIEIFKNGKPIATHKKTSGDIEVMLENTMGGYYTFNTTSKNPDFWNGSIKFCIDPDTIEINEW